MKPDFEAMLTEAHTAAKAAVDAMGAENPRALDCGFAWVTITGNSPLANYCRKRMKVRDEAISTRVYGYKGYPSGWQFWCPGEFRGQAIGHMEAGAKAFRQVLATHGYSAEVHSRYD